MAKDSWICSSLNWSAGWLQIFAALPDTLFAAHNEINKFLLFLLNVSHLFRIRYAQSLRQHQMNFICKSLGCSGVAPRQCFVIHRVRNDRSSSPRRWKFCGRILKASPPHDTTKHEVHAPQHPLPRRSLSHKTPAWSSQTPLNFGKCRIDKYFIINCFILTNYILEIKLSLCFFNWAPRHEGVLAKWRYSSTHSSTSVLDGGEWSASRSGRFTPRERALGTHWIGGWMDPRTGLDAVVKRKNSQLPPGIET
jgi:hypothetical protein